MNVEKHLNKHYKSFCSFGRWLNMFGTVWPLSITPHVVALSPNNFWPFWRPKISRLDWAKLPHWLTLTKFLSSLICSQNFGLDEEKFRKEFCYECPELFYRIAFLCCDLDSDKRCRWMLRYYLCISVDTEISPQKLFLA